MFPSPLMCPQLAELTVGGTRNPSEGFFHRPTSSVLQAGSCPALQRFCVRVPVILLQDGQIMAGLGLQPERHVGIVLGHHLVEETFGLLREALSTRVTFDVPAAFVGFLRVSS